ncbi:MAG: protein kinase [Gammaproteobacteria bacterium]
MRIILVDDSRQFSAHLRRLIAAALPDVEVSEFDPDQLGTPPSGFDWGLYDAVFLDNELGLAQSGIEWMAELQQRHPRFPPVILMSEGIDPYVAAAAIKRGAVEYLGKADIDAAAVARVVPQILRTANRPARHPRLRQDARIVRRANLFSLPDGSRIGYRFVRLIGQGAHCRVYLAERDDDGLTLVLKIIDVETIADPTVLQRFIHEAELIADLHSPHVVRFHGQGFTPNYGYIAVEFFTRGDLKQRIEHGIPRGDALNYALHIAYGLEAIHSVGVVHRDIKPGNIMFRSDDSLALADFGISKRMDAPLDITSTGAILGTPYYISPEQAQGLAVDARTDLYSAGVVLFEMLTGRKAYKADTPAGVVYMHVHADIPRLPPAQARYQPLVDRLLAKNPQDRFQTASELVVNLQSLLHR